MPPASRPIAGQPRQPGGRPARRPRAGLASVVSPAFQLLVGLTHGLDYAFSRPAGYPLIPILPHRGLASGVDSPRRLFRQRAAAQRSRGTGAGLVKVQPRGNPIRQRGHVLATRPGDRPLRGLNCVWEVTGLRVRRSERVERGWVAVLGQPRARARRARPPRRRGGPTCSGSSPESMRCR